MVVEDDAQEMMRSFVCPSCMAESFSLHDMAHKYCGRCHRFVEADPPIKRLTPAEQRRIEEMLKGDKENSGLAPESRWVSEHPHGEKS